MYKNINIDTLTASIKPLYVDKNKKYLAFSGIGNNQSFFDTLIDNNCTVLKTVEFPDHHFFSENDLNKHKKTASDNIFHLLRLKKILLEFQKKKGMELNV